MSHEILTPDQMNEVDAIAIQTGMSMLKLLENAGDAAADEITQRYKKCRVAVLAGPGNNGGDGFVIARRLRAKGWPIKLYLMCDRKKIQGAAAAMLAKWKGALCSFQDFEKDVAGKHRASLLVDAIYGAGLNRDFPKTWAEKIGQTQLPIVAVDLPSGIDGETGQIRGSALQAKLTITFFRKKLAHVLEPGRQHCGQIVVRDIGLPHHTLNQIKVRVHENSAPVLPAISVDSHKFRRGHALVWSGPELQTGAARLAALAAARSGAGLTTLAGPRDAMRVHANHVTSLILQPIEAMEDLRWALAEKKFSAICIGPAAGVNENTRKIALRFLKTGLPTVLDADAISVFKDEPETLFAAIKALPNRGVIITPHEGEFRRLFGALAGSKIVRALTAAQLSGATVIYKGPDTIIANPRGDATVNTNGSSKLATAGSGDLLAGIASGLLAQGMDTYVVGCAAVWLHADAANRCPIRTPIAEDLLEEIGR